MPKNVTLSVSDKRALTQTRNILARLGKKVPPTLNLLSSASSATLLFTPSKGEIARFISSLNLNKQVVVSIKGPKSRFTVMSVNGFVSHQQQAQKINKARFNKKA